MDAIAAISSSDNNDPEIDRDRRRFAGAAAGPLASLGLLTVADFVRMAEAVKPKGDVGPR